MRFAIIVPYRNREEHLQKFVAHMHEYLKGKEYDIYIIEQADKKPFNRGRLLNAGVQIARGYDYYVTHDIDMLPLDAKYDFPHEITHLAGRVEQFRWQLPYRDYMGGVVAFTAAQFKMCGGYPNDYWGWGGEDDALLKGIRTANMQVIRHPYRFLSLPHEPQDKGMRVENRQKLKEGRNNGDGYGHSIFKPVSFQLMDGYFLKRISL